MSKNHLKLKDGQHNDVRDELEANDQDLPGKYPYQWADLFTERLKFPVSKANLMAVYDGVNASRKRQGRPPLNIMKGMARPKSPGEGEPELVADLVKEVRLLVDHIADVERRLDGVTNRLVKLENDLGVPMNGRPAKTAHQFNQDRA